MSRLFLTNIDLNYNSLVKASLDSTAPASIVESNFWWDSTAKTIKVGTGSGTSALLTKSGSIVNADLSGSAGITNANLANSSVTINGTSISLGSSATIKASTTYSLGLTSGGNLAFSSGTTWDGGTTGITIGLSATPTGITSINGISVSGSSGTFVTSATTSLPNVTSVGTLTSLETTGNVTVGGNLIVNGTTTTVNSTTITVDDKNLELGSVTSPDNTSADGGGITLKGTTDKTFNWFNATSAWTSSEHLNLATGKAFYIAGTSVLNGTTLGSGVVNSSLTKVGLSTAGFVKSDSSGNLTVDTVTYAPLNSPGLTGTPTAPTATSGTNTTQIATTAFVQAALSGTGSVSKYSAANGSISAVSGQITWTVNHALGTSDVIVQVYRQSDKALVDVDVVSTDSNNVTLTFVSGNLTGSEYRVVVMG